MNQNAWDDVMAEENRRLRWKVKLLQHKIYRRNDRIKKLTLQRDEALRNGRKR